MPSYRVDIMRNSEQEAISASAFKVVRRPKKLETRLIILVVGVCVFQALFFFALVYNVITQNFHQEVGGEGVSIGSVNSVSAGCDYGFKS